MKQLHRSPRRLFPAVAVPAVADDLPVRARDRRPREPAGGARRQPGDATSRPCVASSASINRSGCSPGISWPVSSPAISACPSTIARPVLELYFQRLPNSLLLAAVAMALSLLIGIPSGILAAVRVDGFWHLGRQGLLVAGPVAAAVLGRAWC